MQDNRYLAALRDRWLLVLGVVLLGTVAAAMLSLRATPLYRASTTVFLSVSRGDTVSELNQGAIYTQNLVKSFSEVVTTPAVLDPVIRDLQLETTSGELASTLSVESSSDSVLVAISATSPSADRSAAVANAVGVQLAKTVGELSPVGPRAAKSINVTTVAVAAVPDHPVSPRPQRDVPVGLVISLALGVLAALGLDLLNGRVRTTSDVRAALDAPVLASVPHHRRRQAVLDAAGRGPGAEAYRALRTNLLADEGRAGGRSVLLTSPSDGDGKTTTAINLSVAMAVAGVRVLLVDADLRRPAVARVLGLSTDKGLSNVLQGQSTLSDALQQWGALELDVLTAGQLPTNPSELLGSQTMAALLGEVVRHYDLVVLDSPAALLVTDAAVLSRHADGTLLVVDGRKTSRTSLERCAEALDLAGAAVVGVVLNKTRQAEASSSKPHAAPRPGDIDAPAAAEPGFEQVDRVGGPVR